LPRQGREAAHHRLPDEEEGEIHSEITTGNYRNFSRHASA
jgi:hypothetical protein